MQALAARSCGLPSDSMLVCSTGRIGRALPMKNVRAGIKHAAGILAPSREAGLNAAEAILTSDTRSKRVTARVPWNKGFITISGMAKGAGMIQPDMATMLAFIATDAEVSDPLLRAMLKKSVAGSFNAITIDGDMSTNDTVLIFANGASGTRVTKSKTTLFNRFSAALDYVCGRLAYLLVSDGERISKVVELSVRGTRRTGDAEKIARAIGNSLLVKTSWYGGDPNWGRLVDAIGYAGVPFDAEKLDMSYRDFPHDPKTKGKPVPILKKGVPANRNLPAWRRIVGQPQFSIILNFNLGKGSFRLLSTDLTEGYVDFNKSE
jgi:glutamate N-acetyltransferase/amino-acid N-acetyltransferase